MEKVDVKEEMEEEPSGRMMGMEGPRVRGRECCLQKEETRGAELWARELGL
jgi:hypothetical protein